MNINSISDVLEAENSAIVIFTRNRQLEIRQDGTGSTGNWVVNPDRNYQRVVIYKRDDANNIGGEIFVANHDMTRKATDEPRRFRVSFKNAISCGKTKMNWKKFADTGSNPIRYIPK